MKKYLWVALMILVLFSIGSAKPRGERQLFKELDLSKTQIEQMKEHHKINREQGEQIRKAMKENMRALQDELSKKEVDLSTVDSLKAKIKELQGQMVDHHVQRQMELKKILTDEQYQKMNEMRKKRFEKMDKKMRGRRPPDGEDDGPPPEGGPPLMM